MTYEFHEPSQALRAAREAEAVNKPENALDALSWALSQSKLNKHWTPEHPQVAAKALQLAVQLRDARKAREVLQNYARVAINNNPAALETAIRLLLNNALTKAREAQQEADSLAADIAAVEDLEETEASPEAMLMSMMSTDGAAERAVRGQTLPWLRIAWECHRIVLDVLRNLPKLESLYHGVVLEMIEFCKEFKRVQEIKKLCAQLRAHLRQFRARVEDAEEPIAEESVDGQLATRFAVLEYACSQSLWNEAFRVVSDIHNIVDFCGTKPSTEMMATYYASLARVFWVSDNVLFHAYALWKYKQQRCHVSTPGAPQPEAGVKPLARASSAVVMAALAVPLYVSDSADDSSRLFAGDSTNNRQRKQRLAKLLEYAGQPSRADILRNLAAENVLASVEPQVAPLLGLLEESFSPLDLVAQLTPTLQWAASKPSLAQYVPALERLAVHRVLQQLSRVYDVVSLDTFHGLLKGLSLPQVEMEKLIVRTADAGALAVRVDHAERVLRLGRSSLESSAMRLHLAHLGAAMSAAMTNMGKDSAGVANARMESAMALAREFSEQTRQENLARMAEIDARVEVAEVAAERAAREAEKLREEEQAQAAQTEAQRQVEAEAAREQAKQELEEKEAAMREKIDILHELQRAVPTSMATLEEMSLEELRTERTEARTKAAEEDARKREEKYKRADYAVRAQRDTELKVMTERVGAWIDAEEARTAELRGAITARAEAQYNKAAEIKRMLAPLLPHATAFEEKIVKQRLANHKQRVRRMQEKQLIIQWENKLARARARKAEEEMEQRRLKEAEEESQRKAKEAMRMQREADREAAAQEQQFASWRQANIKRIESSADARAPAPGGSSGGAYRPPAAGRFRSAPVCE